MDSLQEYAYKPSLVSKLDFSYNIGDKILSSVELIGKFNRSTSKNSVSSVSLNNIVDLNFDLEYKYSSVFSAFLKVRNIVGGYEIWENYPVLAPQIFFGLSFCF